MTQETRLHGHRCSGREVSSLADPLPQFPPRCRCGDYCQSGAAGWFHDWGTLGVAYYALASGL